jgi:hypothetical protein
MSLKQEECVELKNIKYKTMLMSGNMSQETKVANDMSKLDKFLEDDKNNNENEPWTKLDKTVKTRKILTFAEKYTEDNKLTNEENAKLIAFLKDCLDKRKLQRVKDVLYDKTNGEIKEIPALLYNKTNKHFTLKNIDKRVLTTKSLPPQKNRIKTTAKNTNATIDSDSDKEE